MTPPLAALPDELWERARAATDRLLALDYDGTLAPFTVDPADARPLPAARAALARIVRDGRTQVAISSGRPAVEVARLVGLPIAVAGEHGWSLRHPDGGLRRHPLSPELASRLAAAARDAERRLAPARVERKRTAVVVHVRGLDPALAAERLGRTRRLFERRHAHPGLALRPIAAGLELRARGHDKGTALAELLTNGTLAVAIGDDDTDEDAFRVAAARGGFGIRVGPGEAPSAARYRIPSPGGVADFLARWSERVDGRPPPEGPARGR